MRVAALLVLLALAPNAVAGPPAPPPGHPHLVLKKGEPAPADGIFADGLAAQYDYERLRWLNLKLETCAEVHTQEPMVPWWGWVIAGALVGGAAAWKLR